MRHHELEHQPRNHNEDREPNEKPEQFPADRRFRTLHACFYEARCRRSLNDGGMNETPHLLRSREIYKGRIFTVRVDTIEDDGKERNLDIVQHPGSVAIIPILDDGHVVLVRQYRHATERAMWEIPAGTAETGEEPEAGARRELREETGYTADSIELVCGVYPTPGYCTERVWIYAARGLHAGPQVLEEDEHIELRVVSLDEALAMQASTQIIDMKTVLSLLWLATLRHK